VKACVRAPSVSECLQKTPPGARSADVPRHGAGPQAIRLRATSCAACSPWLQTSRARPALIPHGHHMPLRLEPTSWADRQLRAVSETGRSATCSSASVPASLLPGGDSAPAPPRKRCRPAGGRESCHHPPIRAALIFFGLWRVFWCYINTLEGRQFAARAQLGDHPVENSANELVDNSRTWRTESRVSTERVLGDLPAIGAPQALQAQGRSRGHSSFSRQPGSGPLSVREACH
jgi:hypothetical protein